MADPNPRDNTSADYEKFEQARLAQDRDAASIATGDVDDTTAHNLVSELVDTNIVTPIPENQVLVHEPSSTAFDSTSQLAVFHRGWTAARDADAEDE
ncbi:hypothetical protein [Natrinema halophilum]|uniref:hypothetical protein n=1 Tax=Natrinema halophilum TaxID=1699371 RepID=UPI001F2FA641|nr:hypothetical protein [Natrinema halophilum]UHQ96356.1 hypothetical protein HYG82_22120 [Natrinema halophilum]